MPHSSRPSTNTSCHQPAVASVHDKLDTFEDLEVIGDDLDSLLDCFPNEQEPVKVKSQLVMCLSLETTDNG